jgi:hypothetical protein
VKIAIHQPHYLPWLGYLAKWAAADMFVFLDTVQYEKNGWQNRNRIKTRDGAAWLTVPVHAPLGTRIRDVTVATDEPWRRRHLTAIEHAYADAPSFDRFHDGLAALYAREWDALTPLAVASARWLAEAFAIDTPARLASELDDGSATDATGRLVALCRATGADTYLAGRDGITYLDLSQFEAAGIAVLSQAYEHPVYGQRHGAFIPNLSAVDLLLNEGLSGRGVLTAGDRWITPG